MIDFAKLLSEQTEHAKSCTARPCTRCDRARCPSCGGDMPVMGTQLYDHGELRVFEACEPCADRALLREKLKAGESTIPAAFAWARLGAPELRARVKAAKADVDRAYRAGLADRRSLVLLGSPGAGKTSLAVALLRAVFERATRDGATPADVRRAKGAMFASAYDLSRDRARHPLGQGESPLVARAIEATVLLLDDLGSEPDGQLSAVSDVIYARHAEARPTWITTWLEPEPCSRRYGGGIARRVFEQAETIRLGGQP